MFKDWIKDLAKNIKFYLLKIIDSRIGIIGAIFVVFLIIMLGRVFYLQVIRSDYYMENYIQKTEKTIYTAGTRGNIYDRNGELLAYNTLAHSVTMIESSKMKDEEENAIISETIDIIKNHGDKIANDFLIVADAYGNFSYSATSDAELLRFLINVYGYPSDELRSKGLDKATAKETFEYCCSEDKFGISDEYDLTKKLDICAVRFGLSLNFYQKYISSPIAKNVSDETVAAILENKYRLAGVDIEENQTRVYNDSVYFSPIIGYTGQISEEEIVTKNADSGYEYEAGDVIGKAGIEQTFDTYLQGNKGEEQVFVDNMGNILESNVVSKASAGNNLYLTIDAKLQKAAYHILEQKIAGIMISKIVDYDYKPSLDDKAINIAMKDVYFQMINNNVVDVSKLNEPDSTDNEKNVYNKYVSKREDSLNQLRAMLTSNNPGSLDSIGDEYKDYMWLIYDALKSDEVNVLNVGKIDYEDPVYQQFTAEKISLEEFLLHAIQQGWVNANNINSDVKYSNSDQMYSDLVDYIIDYLSDDSAFAKKIYYYLIWNNALGGNEVCRLIYDQGVLPMDEGAYASLGSPYAAYGWMMGKLKSLEITPAMVALDPCSGSVCVTDVNTGDVLAMVTYPTYDNNKLSGYVDAEYWKQLTNDLSLPLYNRATQTRTAPGSTFKPLTSITVLEEGVISGDTYVQDEGEYKVITPSPKCWIYPGSHGSLNVVGALQNSCNYFYYEMGHRLGSLGGDGYDSQAGIAKIRKYGDLVGINSKSGVEIEEAEPHFSDENAVTTAIGQGSNSFCNIQLARYVTTVANGGTNYKLTLFDKITDPDGNLVMENEPVVTESNVFSNYTKSLVHQGMRNVVTIGTAAGCFSGVDFTLAGKTGTAEENKLRSPHCTFIGFSPYENPQMAVSTVIPYGDSSGHSSEISRDVMKVYYGELTLEQILASSASEVSGTAVHD